MGGWTHPSHKMWFEIGANLDWLQFFMIFIPFDTLQIPWFRNMKDETFYYRPILETPILCSVDYCHNATKLPKGEEAGGSVTTGLLGIFVSEGLDILHLALSGVIIVMDRWKGKVLTPVIRVIQALLVISIFIRFFGSFAVVNHMGTVNSKFMQSSNPKHVQIETGPLAIVFASIVVQIVALLCVTVCVDPGAEGESHADRLAREAREAAGITADDEGDNAIERKHSAYKPESMAADKKSVINSVRKSICSDQGVAVPAPGDTESETPVDG